MAKSRMAGDALRDKRERARERIANDPERSADRLSEVDRGKFDLDGYSDKDIIMAYKGGTFDKEDYARLTGRPLGGGGDGDKPKPEPEVNIPTPVVDPAPSPTPGPGTRPGPRPIEVPVMGSGSQTQIVNQDNDVNTNVTGDGNVTNINQDNSVGQYGAYGSAANRSKALRDKYVADISKFARN